MKNKIMKVRDSGMPVESQWNAFFDVDFVLAGLQINSSIKDLVEIGCGYGTFTIPVSRQIKGNLYAFDIENEMLEHVREKLGSNKANNVILEQRDILTQTTGLADNSVDYVMLFNILHHDSPLDFLNESYRILRPSGKIGIIHWRSDVQTPRGPDLSIRPKPEQIVDLLDASRFEVDIEPFIIEPYHYGLLLSKK